MNRRDWLRQAMAGVAALAVDPERLLWTPGERTITVSFRLTMEDIQRINSDTYSYVTTLPTSYLTASWFTYSRIDTHSSAGRPSDRDRRTI